MLLNIPFCTVSSLWFVTSCHTRIGLLKFNLITIITILLKYLTIFSFVSGFKNLEEEDKENCPLNEELSEQMNGFHEQLMGHVSLQALQAPAEEEEVILRTKIFSNFQ